MNGGTEIVGNIRITGTGTEIIGTTAAMAGIHHQIGIVTSHHTLFQTCAMTHMNKKYTKYLEKYIYSHILTIHIFQVGILTEVTEVIGGLAQGRYSF